MDGLLHCPVWAKIKLAIHVSLLPLPRSAVLGSEGWRVIDNRIPVHRQALRYKSKKQQTNKQTK